MITVRDANPEAAVMPVALANQAALLEAFQTRINATAKSAVADAMTEAAEMITGLMDAVKADLASIGKPKDKIVAIEVRDKTVKLDGVVSPILPDLVVNAELNEPTYLFGPAGSGKTSAVEQLAKVLEAEMEKIVLAPDFSSNALFGRQTANGFVHSAMIRMLKLAAANPSKRYIFFIDELDNGNDGVITALNGLYDDSPTFYDQMTGETLPKPKNLVLVAAGNTVGKGGDSQYVSRTRLCASTMRRFWKLQVDYSKEIEESIASAYTTDRKLLEKCWNAREELKRLGSEEILSSGCIKKLHKVIYCGGKPEEKALREFTLGWPEGLAEQVGLVG